MINNTEEISLLKAQSKLVKKCKVLLAKFFIRMFKVTVYSTEEARWTCLNTGL